MVVPIPNETFSLERIRACRTLVYFAFDRLTLPLLNLTLELARESAPFESSQHHSYHYKCFEVVVIDVEQIVDAIRPLLDGTGEVRTEVEKLTKHLVKLQRSIVVPLKALTGKGKRGNLKKEFLKIAKRAKSLHKEVDPSFRFAAKQLRVMLAPKADEPKSTKAESGPRTVVSVDMKEYARHALAQNDYLGVEGLRLFNERLQAMFADALKQAKCNPEKLPTLNTGDGALVFFPNPKQAATFAIKVHGLAIKRGKNIFQESRKPKFRIGIATGDVCLVQTVQAGTVVAFTAAGIPIIDAVRIQGKCEPGAVLVCQRTWRKLPDTMRDRFPTHMQVEPKEHEERKIDAYASPVIVSDS